MVIKTVIKQPNMEAEVLEVENSNDAIKEVLKGGMEAWSINDTYAIYCSNDSLYDSSKYNCKLLNLDFHGTILILKFDDNGSIISMSSDEAELISVLVNETLKK